jgi:hypothetical protein
MIDIFVGVPTFPNFLTLETSSANDIGLVVDMAKKPKGKEKGKDRRVSDSLINIMKKKGIDPEGLKGNNRTGPRDLFIDDNGNFLVKPKDGSGLGEPTGININDILG